MLSWPMTVPVPVLVTLVYADHNEAIVIEKMPVGLEAWFNQVPPITRAWLAAAVLTSLAVVRSAASRTTRTLQMGP